MKKFFSEFRDFISKGNAVDLAVGVIIGSAFSAIVSSLVNDILSPLLGLAANVQLSDHVWKIGEVSIGYGSFLTAVINFIFMAFALFLIIKALDKARELGKRAVKRDEKAVPAAPNTKLCPFCKTEIPIAAVRCPHCTSELPLEKQAE